MLSLSALLLLSITTIASAAPNGPAADCAGINGVKPACKTPEAYYTRDTFFIGGSYHNFSGIGTLTTDQMYVEKLTPQGGVKKSYPLVFFHGGGPSGATWLNTPDNRKGFASLFLEKGYLVYIVDQTSVGRGSQNDIASYPLRFGSTSEISQAGFSRPEASNGYPQSQLHTQWPGTGQPGDPAFDAFESGFVPLTSNSTKQELSMRHAGCVLLSLIGPSFLISHSIGAVFGILLSDECPDLIAGNVNLEPATIPFQSYVGNATSVVGRRPARPFGFTVTNLNYDPPIASSSELVTITVGEDTLALRSCILQSNASTIHTLPNLQKVPYVAFTGEASPHITYDQCVILYLNQVGVKTDWIKLADVGVRGNGHFGYLEKNNVEYFKVVEKWISNESRKKS